MTNNDTRLRAIKQRAKALGWRFRAGGTRIGVKGTAAIFNLCHSDEADYIFALTDKGYEAAERLLACYEPGAVVEILEDDIGQRYIVGLKKVPKGTYKLVKVEDDG